MEYRTSVQTTPPFDGGGRDPSAPAAIPVLLGVDAKGKALPFWPAPGGTPVPDDLRIQYQRRTLTPAAPETTAPLSLALLGGRALRPARQTVLACATASSAALAAAASVRLILPSAGQLEARSTQWLLGDHLDLAPSAQLRAAQPDPGGASTPALALRPTALLPAITAPAALAVGAVRLADGAYAGDNTGVAAALRTLQDGKPGGTFRLLAFASMGDEDNEPAAGAVLVLPDVGALFGLQGGQAVGGADAPSRTFMGRFSIASPQVFAAEGVSRYRVTSLGSDGGPWLSAAGYGDLAAVVVMRYEGLTTVENAAFGVCAGSVVSLDVVGVSSAQSIVPLSEADVARMVAVVPALLALGPNMDAALGEGPS